MQIKLEPNYSTQRLKVFHGDCREVLDQIPDNSIQSCITSPPYWGLRDYETDNQIGAEQDLNTYIHQLVCIFNKVRRVLKDDGVLWLNIGDSYTSGGRTWRDSDSKNKGRGMSYRPPTPEGLKPKDLIGVPWRIALALQQDGWYLRTDIVWNKPNCQPESVKDRPTRSHEFIFMLTKSEKYFYNQEAVKIEAKNGGKKNIRSVWDIKTVPYKEAHFAVFPPELVSKCLLASTKEGDEILDPFLGSGTVAEVALTYERKCLGIELSEKYIELVKQRTSSDLFD